MTYNNDKRTVITLDAGGTNFVFSAIRGNEYKVAPITLPSLSDKLDDCLANLVKGFSMVIEKLDEKPVAISFAFPGPADYPNGIIGGYLPNFPSFRDGVALGPFLQEKFGIPVFINNDGDLFVYGEAMSGVLPEINERLRERGSKKQYHNLLGYTLGTGFGFGFAVDGKLHIGDNSCVEIFCLRNKFHPNVIMEASVSIAAVKRVYGELSSDMNHGLEPKDIFEIAEGTKAGNRDAAIASFARLGEAAGDAMATSASLIDGLVVIGGGLTGARKYIYPALLNEMRSKISTFGGEPVNRVQTEVFDLDDPDGFDQFSRDKEVLIDIYGTSKKVSYDPFKRIGVVTSKIGASRAIALGAYAFALNKIDQR